MSKLRTFVFLTAFALVGGPARAADDLGDDAMTAIEDELPPPPPDDDLEAELSGVESADPRPPAPKADAGKARAPDAVPAEVPATAASPVDPNPAETRGPIVREDERASSTRGEKIFDWSKHRGETEVPHPFADKGLIRIDKNNVYHYRVEETESHRAADFHAGPFNPVNLSNPEDDGPYSFYEDNYNGGAPALLVNYEWQIWNSALGKAGLRAGAGLFFSQGHGHFVHLDNTRLKPLEVFSFAAVPFNFGLVYRMQWFHRQLFVPYVDGGGTLWAFAETRDDGKRPKFGGSAAAYGALGLGINLTYYNALSRIALDREYGIHAMYLIAEYRRTQTLSPHYDFSSNFLNAGLLMEF